MNQAAQARLFGPTCSLLCLPRVQMVAEECCFKALQALTVFGSRFAGQSFIRSQMRTFLEKRKLVPQMLGLHIGCVYLQNGFYSDWNRSNEIIQVNAEGDVMRWCDLRRDENVRLVSVFSGPEDEFLSNLFQFHVRVYSSWSEFTAWQSFHYGTTLDNSYVLFMPELLFAS